jgi:TPR repeat protein
MLKTVIEKFKGSNVADEQVREHFYSLAKQGDIEAMYSYSLNCLFGYGGSQNLGHAEYYLQLAANKGQVDAQYTLGVFYQNDEYSSRDSEKANYWMTIAASNGHDEAQKFFDDDI